MNKYQGALDRLFMWATNGYCALEVPSAEYEDLKEIMQELVEKATPKKLKSTTIGTVELKLCTNCGEAIQWFESYCHGCGQKIDWLEGGRR